ncbi:spore germination protein [Cohnella faecalis]|uniref:Uncharacterized protein n=1 Tax=Cohnella faecalis TaxID=2315694 RepID=A0A398CIZ3_9BACL|nr:hypothetical protein D3H35_18785 [Cohnella faecalis]
MIRPYSCSISPNRARDPFSRLVEALIMEITFEALREAGVRLAQQVARHVSTSRQIRGYISTANCRDDILPLSIIANTFCLRSCPRVKRLPESAGFVSVVQIGERRKTSFSSRTSSGYSDR